MPRKVKKASLKIRGSPLTMASFVSRASKAPVPPPTAKHHDGISSHEVSSPRGSTSALRAAPDRDFGRSRRNDAAPWPFVFHVSATANLPENRSIPLQDFRISKKRRSRNQTAPSSHRETPFTYL